MPFPCVAPHALHAVLCSVPMLRRALIDACDLMSWPVRVSLQDNIVGVSYSVWNGDRIREKREWHGKFAMSGGYTHTVYALNITTPPPPPPALSTATVLATDAASRAGSRNPNLKHLLFYTCVTPQIGNQCEEGFSLDQAGIATSAVSSNFSTIEAGVAHNISILFAVHDTFFLNGEGTVTKKRGGLERRFSGGEGYLSLPSLPFSLSLCLSLCLSLSVSSRYL